MVNGPAVECVVYGCRTQQCPINIENCRVHSANLEADPGE
jgi:hypothetical protein